MKRAASAPAGKRKKRSKTAKMSKMSSSQSQQQQLLNMNDIIDGVIASQSQSSSVMDLTGDNDSCKQSEDSLAYNNLQVEIAKLTSIIEQQQKTISSMETKLNTVLALLHKSDQSRYHQASMSASALASSRSTSLSSPAASVALTSSAAAVTAGAAGTAAASLQSRSSVRPAAQEAADDDFTLIVHRAVNDINRRKRNIVVSGLPEASSGKSDRKAFDEFCEYFMPFKPVLTNDNCCKRIGKQQNGKPRRLLVKLSSEEMAVSLLEAARGLRHSSDQYVAANVFFNADLSPSAAKLAFEERKKRREVRGHQAAAAAASAVMATDNAQTMRALADTAASASVSSSGLKPVSGLIGDSSGCSGNMSTALGGGSVNVIANALNGNAKPWIPTVSVTAAAPSVSGGGGSRATQSL